MKFKLRGLRWYIAGLLCLVSGLNYLDRQTLSVLAQTIQDELHLTTVQYSDITAAFLVSYTVMYAVSGRLIDWLGTRRSFALFVSGWSVANLLHMFARTALQFSFFRFLLGATEAGNFPAGVKVAAEWFPLRERALAIGIFNSGTAVGAALSAPVVSGIALLWGWRAAFVAGGALGAVWLLLWLLFYRLPGKHPWLRPEELRLIEEGKPAPAARPTVSIRRLLATREAWGCIVARMLTDPISYFFIFWTPKFLQQDRGFDLAAIGKYGWIPFMAAAVGNIAGGAVPARLIRRGWTLNRARKTVMLAASCLMPVCCLLVTRVPNAALAVACISVAMFSNGAWANMTLPAEVFPTEVVASVSGFAGALGGLMGVGTQLAIGWTVQNLSFTPVFAACSVAHLTAFLFVCLLVGDLGRIRTLGAAARVETAVPGA
jgi:MFS transporter, ACS family, aldohexuronate transporter